MSIFSAATALSISIHLFVFTFCFVKLYRFSISKWEMKWRLTTNLPRTHTQIFLLLPSEPMKWITKCLSFLFCSSPLFFFLSSPTVQPCIACECVCVCIWVFGLRTNIKKRKKIFGCVRVRKRWDYSIEHKHKSCRPRGIWRRNTHATRCTNFIGLLFCVVVLILEWNVFV